MLAILPALRDRMCPGVSSREVGLREPPVPFVSLGSHVPLCDHLLELSEILVSKYVLYFSFSTTLNLSQRLHLGFK